MASPSPKYKLYYFNFRGRGELIRLLLHTAQVEFIDHRVQPSDWPELKPNTPEGHVPFLEIDGVQYGESLPLARYLAKKYNLMGDTELDQLNADIILNHVDQLRLDYVRFKTDSHLTPEQKQILEDKFQKQDVPKFMNKIEKRLVKSTSKYLAGDKLSIADLAVADVLDTFIKENPSVLDSYPSLSEHKAMVMGLPQLSNYLSCRPDTKL
ncbi:glutathione S-transferase 3-like isoform X1 [Biomphalaria pfeifferi]|uniref:Glutathione S-transferase 3-like isoform X1 n=1 Tax=Biomphalaria pfeifferi TaxID=112525 RepID=A0AAD8C0U1_BIOPF|nr:glutathione S-transferase 3-like isoform X1 [Biomphalaria pfeifferi]